MNPPKYISKYASLLMEVCKDLLGTWMESEDLHGIQGPSWLASFQPQIPPFPLLDFIT